jgi:tRNA-Thr(GGU) m(6)t(6)A37 methyltransferase TsaA
VTGTVEYEAIGTIHTPFDSPKGMPIQPTGSEAAVGTVELASEYADGLADLAGFSHCILVYHFHAAEGASPLRVEPFLDDAKRGLFATRAPRRPNPIGLSVVGIEAVEDRSLTVCDVDVVDGTPLLDLKPFVPVFDAPAGADSGWLDGCREDARSARADDRFL